MEQILKGWQLNPGASDAAVRSVAELFGIALPADYLQFLHRHDGGEGFIGNKYLIFWKAEYLGFFNHEYEVEKYAPGIILFGSNGRGDGYGFDTRSAAMLIVRVPFIGMDLRYVQPVFNSFTALLQQQEN